MAFKAHISIARLTQCVALALLAGSLVACGGGANNTPGAVPAIGSTSGGAGTGAGTGSNSDGKVTLTLTDASGTATALMTFSKPLTVTAAVRDSKGLPAANKLVVFDVDQQLVTVSPSTASAVTDAQGNAKVTLTPLSLTVSGGGIIKAVALLGDVSAVGSTVFSIGAANLALKLITPTSTPALLKAYGSQVITLDVQSNGVPLTSEALSIDLASACAAAGKATLPARVATINGRAQVVYRDQGCAQADSVIASIAGANVALSIGFQASPPAAASIEVGSVMPVDRSIVIKGAGGSNRSETASVAFKVVDQFGNPLANQNVRFATISTKPVTLNKAADSTDAQGMVTTTVNSGSEPTALRIQATLDSGLSTISDTISVTTGLPIQKAFSLSVTEFNIEGWDYDNVTTDVTILLADQFGNPVADGTPVVFQTDSGAIGSSDRGGCNTINGGCVARFRSQNPRYAATTATRRAGVATIMVSTSDNSNTALTGNIQIALSGRFATRFNQILDDGTVLPRDGSGVSIVNTGCSTRALRLQFSDERNNALPNKTSLTATAVRDLQIDDILPGNVLSSAPSGSLTAADGTIHTILVSPSTSCVTGGARSVTGTAQIKLQTPAGNVSLFPISMTFPVQ